MSWKKVFYYLIWFLYTLMTGCALIGLAGLTCVKAGLAAYWGILAASLYVACVGGSVFLLRRVISGASFLTIGYQNLFVVLEAISVVTLLVIGLLFRIQGAEGAGQWTIYYEMAEVALGQKIPQIAHGAIYLYLQVLHGALTLFGNHFVVGIWLQIALQLGASFLLFYSIRKLAGPIAALVSFGFCMCAPYMIQNALVMSPEMLYFSLLAVACALMSAAQAGKGKQKPLTFFLMGILTALCFYMDIVGILLFIPALGFVLCERKEKETLRGKVAAVVLCLLGGCLGFLGCVYLDAFFSGTAFWQVAQAWFLLYWPKGFCVPALIGGTSTGLEGIVLVGVMTFGIFSFWCSLHRERMAVCMVAVCSIVAGECCGIFTYEMPGFFYLYILFVVLAGLGVAQCFDIMPSTQAVRAENEWEIFDVNELAKDACEGQETIENPLPLPKKHTRRVLDYPLEAGESEADYDYPVAEDDDFDI